MSDTGALNNIMNVRRRLRDDALQMGPRKKMYDSCLNITMEANINLIRCLADPLIHHGRHFGRTVHALCNVHAVITNGLLRMGELADEPEDSFTQE